MINLVALGTKVLQAQFLDAANNPVAPGPSDTLTWEVTGPANLSNTYPSDPVKRNLNSTGAVGTGEVKVTLNQGQPGAITLTEPYTVGAGPITHGQIIVIG